MSKPINIINHTSVIPKNSSSYHESFETIILPKDFIYKITSITCKIDTTSLWNITKTNIVTAINSSNQTVTMTIVAGYYNLIELTQALSGVSVGTDNRAYINNVYTSMDFTDSPDIANILGFEQKSYNSTSKSSKPVDITNNKSVVKIYSSLMEQTFGIKSSLIDNLIHVSTGLNNVCTFDNLDISVVSKPNLDYINWSICDADDNPLSLNSNVYINFTISVFRKQK